ncbi:MAG: CAP domain-containing protein [Cyanobacteria bacterium SZAS-4]|nr:CAP domain-containing protein [Cyanobacteria bacterium SZAS-4]
MKTFEPQSRFRKLIALSALLPYLAAGTFNCAFAKDSKATDDAKSDNSGTAKQDAKLKDSASLFAPPGKAQTAPLPSDNKNATNSSTTGGASASQPNWLSTPAPSTTTPSTTTSSPSPTSTTSSTSTPSVGATPAGAGANKAPGSDSYPSVGRMEHLTFGSSFSDSPIEQRLTKLETAIYQKSFSDLSLFDRTQQLKKTLLGNDDEPTADIDNLRVPSNGNWLGLPSGPPFVTDQPSSEFDYFGGIAQRPENQQTTTPADMKDFFLELINSERSKSGFAPLALDSLAEKIAQEQSEELCKRSVISHANSKGENPDRRYTVSGGTGALTESLVSNKTPDAFSKSPTRAAAAELMKTLMSRQDDRDAILNQDATNIGLAINWTANKDRIIAVTEVVTNHGIIPELPHEVGIGEKLEIKGVVMQPYQFDRITLAWEANKNLTSTPDESEEALPYFPPLDYVAYAGKSAHDYSGAVSALRTAGVIAAIAGGIFMPPVALAAPLIAMSGGVGTNDPKPVSDIPIHGGVKVEGLTFNGKVPINKDGKEGIYYVTIWGTLSKMGKSVPISRRAILAKHVDEDVSAKIETPADEATSKDKDNADDKEQKKKEKHHKHKDKS